MNRSLALKLTLVLLAAAIVLILVGMPKRSMHPWPVGPAEVFKTRSVATFLRGTELPSLVRVGEALEQRLIELMRVRPSVGYLARSVAKVLEPEVTVRPADRAAVSELPLRAIEGLGERGEELLRGSSRNVALLPARARESLAALVTAQNAIHRHLLEQRNFLGGDAVVGPALKRLQETMRRKSDASNSTEPDSGKVLERFDRRDSLRQLISLADQIDQLLPVLRKELTPRAVSRLESLQGGDGIPRNLAVAARIEAGILLIGGPGTTIIPLDGVALALDLAGDDRWCGGYSLAGIETVEPLVRLCVDLAGDDKYRGQSAQLGGCVFGLSVLVDVAGEDQYESNLLEFGAAVLGCGMLIDLDGNDSYRCDMAGLGFGLTGMGVLFDAGGDDRYESMLASLGSGAAGGAGILVEHWGDDLYLALGPKKAADPAGVETFALGAGWSPAPGLPAGVGLVLERRGSDIYRVGGSSLGSARGAGSGCMLDAAGDDLYSAGSYSLGAGVDAGLGLMRDLSGDDEYLSSGHSQGYGGAGVGLLIDDAGEDRFLCRTPSHGTGRDGGSGVYADLVRE